jgi:hypothetical protein
LENYHDGNKNNYKIHNTIFAAMEYFFFRDSEKNKVYLFRHYLNYIFNSLAFVFLYKIIRIDYTRSYGFLGVCLFLTSPKILPDFVYSPNDIWLLTTLLISYYYSCIFLKKQRSKHLFLFICFLCLSINIRYIGFYLLPIFLLFYFQSKKNYIKFFCDFFLISILVYFGLLIITPQLWVNPLGLFELFINQLFFDLIDPKIMFLGQLTNSSELPWFYLLLWVLISTPLVIIFFFIMGLLIFILKVPHYIKKQNKKFLSLSYSLSMFFVPLAAFMFFKPSIFNGWRHFYFIYPYLILISIYAIFQINNLNLILFKKKKILSNLIIILLIVHSVNNLFYIFKSNPYQHVYLNNLSKKFVYKFELDYWGLSNYEALKKILFENKDNNDKIFILGLNSNRPDLSSQFLTEGEKKKLIFVNPDLQKNYNIDYFITSYLEGLNDKELIKNNYYIWKEIYSNNIKINTIFKKKIDK